MKSNAKSFADRCAKTRRTSGFTLVELLVVISVIAILISLLVPSLIKAREKMRTTTCLANQKAIGTALHFYAAENSGLCVPRMIAGSDTSSAWAGPPGYPIQTSGGTTAAYWSDQILLGQYTANTNGQFNNPLYTFGTVSVHSPFICPSDLQHPAPDGQVGHLSYGMGPNFPSVVAPGTVGMAPPYSNLWKLESVEKPSAEMVATDCTNERFSPGGYAEPYPFYGNYEPIVNFNWNGDDPNSIYNWARRHMGGGANVVFVDGHAEWSADLKASYDRGEISVHRVE